MRVWLSALTSTRAGGTANGANMSRRTAMDRPIKGNSGLHSSTRSVTSGAKPVSATLPEPMLRPSSSHSARLTRTSSLTTQASTVCFTYTLSDTRTKWNDLAINHRRRSLRRSAGKSLPEPDATDECAALTVIQNAALPKQQAYERPLPPMAATSWGRMTSCHAR